MILFFSSEFHILENENELDIIKKKKKKKKILNFEVSKILFNSKRCMKEIRMAEQSRRKEGKFEEMARRDNKARDEFLSAAKIGRE